MLFFIGNFFFLKRYAFKKSLITNQISNRWLGFVQKWVKKKLKSRNKTWVKAKQPWQNHVASQLEHISNLSSEESGKRYETNS